MGCITSKRDAGVSPEQQLPVAGLPSSPQSQQSADVPAAELDTIKVTTAAPAPAGGMARGGPAAALAAVLVAAAAVCDAPPLELDEDQKAWKMYNGAAFESALTHDEALGGSPVRLVDARFLVALAKAEGGRLVRRQDLPAEAFIDLETVKRLPEGFGGGLRIIAVSQYASSPPPARPQSTRTVGRSA